VKQRLCRLALCAAALFSLSVSGYAQAPTATAPAASAPATTPAPAATSVPAAKPAALPNLDAGSSIVNDPNVTGAFKLSALDSAAMTPQGASRGDTAWMIVATALVMLMTPGLAFFYGGLVRGKNVLNTLMMSFVALGIISIQWMLWGYSVAFGPTALHIFGKTTGFWSLLAANPISWMGLRAGAGPTPVSAAPTIPGAIFMLFQMTFAIITPALISGAVAERIKFSAYCVFILLWATFFYDPLAHMVWGGGFIGTGGLHALDFAGGTVVHISSGVSALTLAIMLGKRRGHGSEEMRPHNVPFVLLGAALLWFGWFGFNAGSQLAADGVSTAAFINTHIATAAAAMSWILVEWIRFKKPTAVGFASGAVAGLVAITPACGWVDASAALMIGLIVSPICLAAISLKGKLNVYDDALDVFGVHACGGMWGAIATGLWANNSINSLVKGGTGVSNGIFSGQPDASLAQLWAQLGAIGITIVCAVISTLLWGTVTKFICGGLRAPADDEEAGLDLTNHGEVGYGAETGGHPALAGID
jgi:Amt family ammonium transporter